MPEKKLKKQYLQVRVDEAESKAFHDAATLAGQGLSGWVRLKLREAASRELAKAGQPVAFFSKGKRTG
jgi:predicted HicB family RNase H-like nuclease